MREGLEEEEVGGGRERVGENNHQYQAKHNGALGTLVVMNDTCHYSNTNPNPNPKPFLEWLHCSTHICRDLW